MIRDFMDTILNKNDYVNCARVQVVDILFTKYYQIILLEHVDAPTKLRTEYNTIYYIVYYSLHVYN